MIKCNDCGVEGIHACLGKELEQEDLPSGVTLVGIGDLHEAMKRMNGFEGA